MGPRIERWASAALRRGSAPAHRSTPTMVTSLSGRDGDICIGRTHDRVVGDVSEHKVWKPILLNGCPVSAEPVKRYLDQSPRRRLPFDHEGCAIALTFEWLG